MTRWSVGVLALVVACELEPEAETEASETEDTPTETAGTESLSDEPSASETVEGRDCDGIPAVEILGVEVVGKRPFETWRGYTLQVELANSEGVSLSVSGAGVAAAFVEVSDGLLEADFSFGASGGPFSYSVLAYDGCSMDVAGWVADYVWQGGFPVKSLSGAAFSGNGEAKVCAVTAVGGLVCSGTHPPLPQVTVYGEFQEVFPGPGWDAYGCALTVDGEPVCWGSATIFDYLPSEFYTPDRPMRKLAMMYNAICALFEDDEIECWSEPWDDIFTGHTFDAGPYRDAAFAKNNVFCAIDSEGDLECSGSGLSDFDLSGSVSGDFEQVHGAWWGVCAVDGEGAVSCWTDPGSYFWFDGYSLGRSAFLDALPTGGVRSLALHDSGACAVMDDGSAHCWGMSEPWATHDGGLSRGVPAGNHWTSVVASLGMACWLDDNQGIYCNGYGNVDPTAQLRRADW